jgi:hypothetical protein
MKRRYLIHIIDDGSDGLDEILLVVSDGFDRDYVLRTASAHLRRPVISSITELLPSDTNAVSVADYRAFIG